MLPKTEWNGSVLNRHPSTLPIWWFFSSLAFCCTWEWCIINRLFELTGPLQIWAHGRDVIPHSQPYRQVPRAANSEQKEASTGRHDSHAFGM